MARPPRAGQGHRYTNTSASDRAVRWIHARFGRRVLGGPLTTAPARSHPPGQKGSLGMSASSSDHRGRPWLRQAAAAVALASIALLLAACSGGGGGSGGGGSAATSDGPMSLQSLTTQALAYAKCMRSHGISDFPDPTVHDSGQGKGVGFNTPSGVDQHSPQYQSANKTCMKQTGFGHISAAQQQQAMNALLKYAECMRSHGLTNFPDPFANSQQIGFNITGIDMNSPRYKAANKTCQPLMPGGGP